MNSNETTVDFTYDKLEEKIGEEIERILIDVYNSHITPNQHIQFPDYKDIDLFCRNESEITNLLLLQVLLSKIRIVMEIYREKIYENEEVNQIRQHYYEKKNIIAPNDNTLSELEPQNELQIINPNLLLPSFPLKENDAKQLKQNTDIIQLLYNLKCIKHCLIVSSRDIEKIFSYPLSFLKLNEKVVKFSFEYIQIEEYSRAILNDEVISRILLQIKTIDKTNLILKDIDNDPLSPSNETARLIEFIDQRIQILELYQETKNTKQLIEELENSLLKGNKDNIIDKSTPLDNVTKTSNVSQNTNQILTQNPFTIQSNTKPQKKNKRTSEQKAKELDIDQLVNYILQEDENKGKKNKKKKNKLKTNNKEDIQDEIDKEIETVKESFKNNSCNKYLVRKIQPCISQDWINTISNSTL